MGRIIAFDDPCVIVGAAGVVGGKEAEGRLGGYFDLSDSGDKFGMQTFEQAESEMQRLALNLALKKAALEPSDLDAVMAGDLLNQCVGSSYGLASFGAPYIGLYGACSTAAEGLMLGAISIASGAFKRVGTVSSSHNSSAERQFRFPLEYGSQRPPTAQWTATASGAFILAKNDVLPSAGAIENTFCRGVRIGITEALPGRIVDKGIVDQSNMGAAMAPAAASTLYTYFSESGHSPREFDLILTGDLGREGSAICRELLEAEGVTLGQNYTDCGQLIYGQSQDTHSGGSGCGCSAAVTACYVTELFVRGDVKEVLLVGTGALMNPSALLQGLSISGVGHLVRLSALS